jgi:hypothetical protein
MASMEFDEFRDGDEEEEFFEERRPRRGCLRGLLRLLLVLLLPVLLAVALAPTLLSSDAGRRWALGKINAAAAPAEVAFDEWSLGWFSAPVLTRVTWRDASRGADLRADEVAFDRGLLRLLPAGVLSLGRVTLKNPALTATLVPPEAEAAPEGAGEGAKRGGFFFLPVADLSAELCVQDGQAMIASRAAAPFCVQQVNGSVAVASFRKPIGVQAQMQVGGGTITLEGSVQSLQELIKGEPFEKPEKLTLKLVGVDLTAFGPLIEHASGEPWIRSGVAEGAFAAEISGPSQVRVEGGLLASGLSVAGGRQAASPKGDLALMADASWDGGVVSIGKFELSSPWLRADARGKLQPGAQAGTLAGSISAKAESDLAVVARDFGPLLSLSKAFSMRRGRLSAAVEVSADERAVSVDASLTTADLDMAFEGEPLTLKPAPSLALKASFPYGGWPEVENFRLKAPFADVYGSGRFESAAVKGRLDLTLFSRDFKRVLKDAPPMVGAATIDLSSKRAGERVALSALLKLSDIAAELRPGQRLVVPQGALKAEGYVPEKDGKPEGEIQDAMFELTLESGKAAGGWKRLAPAQGDRALVLRGFSMTSDLELGSVRRLLGGFIPAGAQRRMTEWRGRVLLNATAEVAGGVAKARVKAAGQQVEAGADGGVWRVPDVRLDGLLSQESPQDGARVEATLTGSAGLQRDGETVFVEKDARVALKALIPPGGDRVRLESFELASSLGEVQAQAEVTELATRCVVDAKGRMAVDFAALTELLEAQGVDEFRLAGRGPRDFQFRSPVAGGLSTIFSDGAFSWAADLESLKGLGLDAGRSDVSVKLAGGVMRLAYEPALNGGKLKLVPELRVERGAATLSVPPRTRLLEGVKLNQEMVDKLLVNVNPLFQGSKLLDGEVTLDAAACRLASGLSPEKGVYADLGMVFKNLKLEMGPELRELLAILKVDERVYRAEQLPIRVTVRDGRIHVDPIRMVIDKQPVIFSGWVAFDGTIKYLVEVPLTDRVTGGSGDHALKGLTIKIPVTGTVNEPRLDTSALKSAVGNVLKRAVGEQNLERIGTFLEKLQEELKK